MSVFILVSVGVFYGDKWSLVTIFKSFSHRKMQLKIMFLMQVIPLLASLGNITCDKPDVTFLCILPLTHRKCRCFYSQHVGIGLSGRISDSRVGPS